jgi:hypothetical protein
MQFVRGVVVDVECYPEEWPAQIAAQASSAPWADCGLGRIILGPNSEPDMGWPNLARWLHAVPLAEDGLPLFGEEEGRRILPLLVRNAYDTLLVILALARLADAAADQEQARTYLWRQAWLSLLEVRCRTAGDVTTGRKWLPARARRLGLVDSAEAVDAAGFEAAVRRCGLLVPDAWQVTRIEPASGSQRVSFGGRESLLTRNGRLLNTWRDTVGSTADVVADVGAANLVRAIRRAEVDLVLIPEALERAFAC